MTEVHRICVEVPATANVDADQLFTVVADAAFDWEPEDRDGWDINVYASVISGADVTETRDEQLAAERKVIHAQWTERHVPTVQTS